jgi:hypothetical protein
MHQYLIIPKEGNPFTSRYFDAENHFDPEHCHMVIDLVNEKYTTDGQTWNEVMEDHL